MPNTEVKLLSADGSWIYAARVGRCRKLLRPKGLFYAQNKTEGLMKSINQNVVALRRVSV